jgi:hypothetical protein
MNFRFTTILFLLILVLVIGLLITVSILEDSTRAGSGPGLVPALSAAGLSAKDIDTVEMVRGQEELLFVKTGENQWRLEKPRSIPVDSFLVENLIRDLFQAEPIDYPGRTDNPAVHGLLEPTVRITLKSGAAHTATVHIGDTTLGGSEAVTFVATGDRPNLPLAVKRSALAGLFRDSAAKKDGPAIDLARNLTDFRIRRPLGAGLSDPVSDLEKITLSTGEKTLTLARMPSGIWGFLSPEKYGEADVAGDPQPNATAYTGVRPLLNALTNLQVGGSEDFIEQPEDLASYGLDAGNKEAVRIELKSKSGDTQILTIGKVVEKDGKPVFPTKVYAQRDGDHAVMMIPFTNLAMLRSTILDPNPLRNRDLFPEGTRDQLVAIDLTVGNQTVRLRKVPTSLGSNPQWVLYGGPGDPQLADQSKVDSLISALTRPRLAKDILIEPKDSAFAEPERKALIKFWAKGFESTPKLENEKYPPEPKPLGTPTELLFGQREADTVLVRRSGLATAADFQLPDTLLEIVTRTRLDYLNPNWQSFVLADVIKLQFNRGTETFLLTKSESKDSASPEGRWTFQEPSSLQGRTADTGKITELLELLLRTSPRRVIADQPSAERLKAWGLDPESPRMKIILGRKPQTEPEIRYDLGNTTDDNQHVYARQHPGMIVVTVSQEVFNQFQQIDLRDTTLFRFDPADVKSLTLRGWKSLTGTVLTYQFEKREGAWQTLSPPSPSGFQADPNKLNSLISALKALKILANLGEIQPDYGLNTDLNPEGIELTIELKDGKKLNLILGKPASADAVYGSSSELPKEAFTLNAGELRKLLEKPANLQKP